MARKFVLSNILCFLLNKLNKHNESIIKKTLVDFYNPAVFTEAKNQLIEDIKDLESTDDMPDLPTRRGNDEQHSVRVIEDIFTLLKYTDNKQIESVTYICH